MVVLRRSATHLGHCLLRLSRDFLNLLFNLLQALVEIRGHHQKGVFVHHVSRFFHMEYVQVALGALVDFLRLFFAEPFDTLAIFPQTEFDFFVLGNDVFSKSVLLSTEPVSFVGSSISPDILTKSVLFVVLVLALIFATVLPEVDSHAFHVVLEPLAFISASI
jgi:hypothetical protein